MITLKQCAPTISANTIIKCGGGGDGGGDGGGGVGRRAISLKWKLGKFRKIFKYKKSIKYFLTQFKGFQIYWQR